MVIGTVGRMRDSSPHHCCNFIPCVQTAVRSGDVLQKVDLIHIVWPNPSNLLFIRHALPSMCERNILHFALLLCCTHLAHWNTDDPGRAGQCHCPGCKVRKSNWCHNYDKKKIGWIYFVPTFIILKRVLKKLRVGGWIAFSWLKTWSNGGFIYA
jgi:hypothetical protein